MSKTKIVDIRGNLLPSFQVPAGTFVVWRNLDPISHSVETRRNAEPYFNAGAMLPGATSSPVLFSKPGTYEYLCRFHTGMFGTVSVNEPLDGHNDHAHGGHQGHGLNHFHGFVTGGRSSQRIYMTHTPVLADERHNYQVILRGRILDANQGKAYESLRNSPYGHGVIQIFHDHMSMPDIGNGIIKELPDASVSFYPGGQQTPVTGIEEHVRIALDQVIHFHQFDTEAPYPPEMTYLMYGDHDDVFIDHYIDRAPSFHSVAKLKSSPPSWAGSEAGAVRITVPGRSMRDIPTRLLDRAAIVDNSFHLFWLLPPGFLERQAQDPLIRRSMGAAHAHRVRFENGTEEDIEIEHFLHFDIRLLNYGVLIV